MVLDLCNQQPWYLLNRRLGLRKELDRQNKAMQHQAGQHSCTAAHFVHPVLSVFQAQLRSGLLFHPSCPLVWNSLCWQLHRLFAAAMRFKLWHKPPGLVPCCFAVALLLVIASAEVATGKCTPKLRASHLGSDSHVHRIYLQQLALLSKHLPCEHSIRAFRCSG